MRPSPTAPLDARTANSPASFGYVLPREVASNVGSKRSALNLPQTARQPDPIAPASDMHPPTHTHKHARGGKDRKTTSFLVTCLRAQTHRTTSHRDFGILVACPVFQARSLARLGGGYLEKGARSLPPVPKKQESGRGGPSHPPIPFTYTLTQSPPVWMYLPQTTASLPTARGAYSIHSQTTHTPRPDNPYLGPVDRRAANTLDSLSYLDSRVPVKAPAPGEG